MIDVNTVRDSNWNSPIFCCYSADLKKYLCDSGMRYEICALNPNNNQMFWAYLRNDELDKRLKEWSNIKRK